MANILRKHSTFISEGNISGKLYDLGAYPGLVYDLESTEQVYGHVFQLESPNKVFTILDKYEGIDPLLPDQNEYRRALCPIQTVSQTLSCWTYLYQQSIDDFRQISSGNYATFLASEASEKHHQFLKGG